MSKKFKALIPVDLVNAHFRVFHGGDSCIVQIKITPYYFKHGYAEAEEPLYGHTEEYSIRDQIKAQIPEATSWIHLNKH